MLEKTQRSGHTMWPRNCTTTAGDAQRKKKKKRKERKE
jgi:hypothetical protein